MTYKLDDLWHFNLGKDSTRHVISLEIRGIADRERVRALDRDLEGLAAIKFIKTFDFGERDKVSVFQTMSGLVQTSNETVLVLESLIRPCIYPAWHGLTLPISTTIPVSGCSPVGSMHVNFGPKSLNAALPIKLAFPP